MAKPEENAQVATDPVSEGLNALLAHARDFVSLDDEAGLRALPPVEQWNPPFCGDIDMEIKADGRWFYQGTPILRAPLVRLFSTVLRCDEDGETYLVTPVEKLRIRVEDAPFLAVEMAVSTKNDVEVLTFRTSLGDVVEAGPDHALHFKICGPDQQLKPYIHVRGRLNALLSRALTYDLLALGAIKEHEGEDMFVISSHGIVFPVMPAAALEAFDAGEGA